MEDSFNDDDPQSAFDFGRENEHYLPSDDCVSVEGDDEERNVANPRTLTRVRSATELEEPAQKKQKPRAIQSTLSFQPLGDGRRGAIIVRLLYMLINILHNMPKLPDFEVKCMRTH
eukprot:jgi/Botrbrau1/3816/Bobra.0183s0046.1